MSQNKANYNVEVKLSTTFASLQWVYILKQLKNILHVSKFILLLHFNKFSVSQNKFKQCRIMGAAKNEGQNYIRFDWAIKRLLRNKADFGAVNGLLSCLFEKQIFITTVLESEGKGINKDIKI